MQGLNWLDWILIAALAVGLIVGYQRGLIGVALGLLGFVIALFLAGRYAGPITAWADTYIGLTRTMADFLHRNVKLPPELAQVPLSALATDKVAQVVGMLPLPAPYKAMLLERLAAMALTQGNTAVASALFDQIAHGIVSALTFMVLVALLGSILAFIGRRAAGLVDAIPLVGPVNRWLGALVVGAEVVLAGAVLLALVSPMLSLPSWQGMALAVSTSRLAGPLMDLYGWAARAFFGRAGTYFLG